MKKWEISVGRLVWGILSGIVFFAVAYGGRYAVGIINSTAASSGHGLKITSDLFDFVNGPFYLILVGALIVVRIAHGAIRSPLTVRGPLKAALYSLTAIFYYLILAGGAITFAVSLSSPASGSFAFSLTLIVTLILLELSAVLRIAQGALEYRDGRIEEMGGANVEAAQATEPTLPPPPPASASTSAPPALST